MSAITIVNAKKQFGALLALGGINLTVKKGEFFGLLGPNGAGKTTLIHSIVGLCKLTEGSIAVHDHDVRKNPLLAKSLIGFSPQDVNLDRFFPIKKILMYQGGFFGMNRKEQKEKADELLEQFGLTEKADSPYYRLSGGMQKRLLIAKAVMSRPQVLILDEPTAGVDVEQRHMLWAFLRNLNKDGTSIVLTTHYIDEAETLCERIGIIHKGEIREIGSPQDLITRYCPKKVRLKVSEPVDPKTIGSYPFELHVEDHSLIGQGNDVGQMIETFNNIVSQNKNSHIIDVSVDRGSLEEVFLKVTGARMAEGHA